MSEIDGAAAITEVAERLALPLNSRISACLAMAQIAFRDQSARIRQLEGALQAIRQWDHLATAGDGDYWKRFIDFALSGKSETHFAE